MTEHVINILITGFLSVFALFFSIWIVHLFLKNAGIVDIGWGLGFILLSAIYVLSGEGFTSRNLLMLFMVGLWGLRISFFLLKRFMHDKEEDRRYQAIREQWKSNIALKFFFFFEFQALLQMFLAVPFLLISLNPNPQLSFIEILGFIIYFLALVGETITDEQLHKFKSDLQNKGKICQEGLWYYSRHPNYFFEWMIWMGFFIFALGSPMGWVSVISPLILLYLILKVSGVPLAEEQALKRRGDEYRKYQRTTSVFIPLPKRME